MKVALVYDRVNKFGGAERVLLALHKIYPDAPLYTLVYDREQASWSKDFKVIPTFLNKISFLRRHHEILAPIAPLAFETFSFDQYDVVISITSSDAKSIITKPNTLHICYCLTPTRYFWSGESNYSSDIKMRILPKSITKYLRTVDLLTSKRPDRYVAISEEVKNRVEKYYDEKSDIVYPAIDDKFYSDRTNTKKDKEYYLIVSRLVPYKSVDMAIQAFNKLKKRLIIVGEGSETERLKKMSHKNIFFAGAVDDNELIDLYKNAKAVVFPQEEDFGLVPIEAQASGTPVIAYAKGGALETVVPGKTGILFDQKTDEALILAVKEFENISIDNEECLSQSKKFSESRFIKEFSEIVDRLWTEHKNKLDIS